MKNRNFIISLAIALLIGVFSGCGSGGSYQKNLSEATSAMLSGGIMAEECAGLIHDVWYNTIYEKSDSRTNKYTWTYSNSGYYNDDFNTSLRNLFSDPEFSAKISLIKSNQARVQSMMKKLTNPPAKYSSAFAAVRDLYDSYLDLTNLAVDPSGNLTSYTSNYNKADSDFAKNYKTMQLYMD